MPFFAVRGFKFLMKLLVGGQRSDFPGLVLEGLGEFRGSMAQLFRFFVHRREELRKSVEFPKFGHGPRPGLVSPIPVIHLKHPGDLVLIDLLFPHQLPHIVVDALE